MKNEFYITVRASNAQTPEDAIAACRQELEASLKERGLDFTDVVFRRFFCSDVYHQTPLIKKLWPMPGQMDIHIGQQPLDSRFISVQAYAIKGLSSKKLLPDGSLLIQHGSFQSLWTLDYPAKAAPASVQTSEILDSCQQKLERQGMNFADDVIRTWYYLRDIDNNYAGMIDSRVDRYESWGLTPDTHFIASTGIEGRSPWPHALVGLNAHAVKGLAPGQITYLKALDHLSPTALYGVNFERATKIDYGDRCHCHLSGTASIDKDGMVLHQGNVKAQAERTIENIQALLSEGGLDLEDMLAATVYLRDSYAISEVREFVKSSLPARCAVNFTCGAVCRPDWLIEIDGEAGKMQKTGFPDFLPVVSEFNGSIK